MNLLEGANQGFVLGTPRRHGRPERHRVADYAGGEADLGLDLGTRSRIPRPRDVENGQRSGDGQLRRLESVKFLQIAMSRKMIMGLVKPEDRKPKRTRVGEGDKGGTRAEKDKQNKTLQLAYPD